MKVPMVVTLLAAMFMAAGCSSGAEGSETGAQKASPSTSPTAISTASSIPNGTYSTAVSRVDALAAGYSKRLINKTYGTDWVQGSISFKFDGDRYSILVKSDGNPYEVGDSGSFTTQGSMLVATSESEGCHGCVYTYRWSLQDRVLSLKVLKTVDVAGRTGDSADVRLVTEHDYTEE